MKAFLLASLVAGAWATPTPTPAVIPAAIHAVLRIDKTEINGTALWEQLATSLAVPGAHIRVRNITSEGKVNAHVYIVNPANAAGAAITHTTVKNAIDALPNSDPFKAAGAYPHLSTTYEWNEQLKYNCQGCPAGTWSKCHAPPLALHTSAYDSPFLTVKAAYQSPTNNAHCKRLLDVMVCARSQPACHAGARLKLCRSHCDAVVAFCPPELLTTLKNAAPLLPFAWCNDSAEFEQGVNSATTPCRTVFDETFLKNVDSTKPCTTTVPFIHPVVNESTTTAAFINGTRGIRATAWLHLEKAVLIDSDNSMRYAFRQNLVRDMTKAFAPITATGATVSFTAWPSTVKTSGNVVPVYFDNVKIEGKYHTLHSLKDALDKAVALAPWVSQYGATTVEWTNSAIAPNCTTCPAYDSSKVSTHCKAWTDDIYGANLRTKPTPLTEGMAAALTALSTPAIQHAESCVGYIKSLVCAAHYPPCHVNASVPLCKSACENVWKFCSATMIRVLNAAPELALLRPHWDCTKTYVTTQPCFEPYSTSWVGAATCAPPAVPATKVPTTKVPAVKVTEVPVAAPVAAKLKASVPNPEKIHVCGGCSGASSESNAAIACPAKPSVKLELLATRCMELPAAGCNALPTCGKTALAATELAYYTYTGSSTDGKLVFFTDAACTTNASTSNTLNVKQGSCSKTLHLVPGGISVATMSMGFDGVLTKAEQDKVEEAFQKKFTGDAKFKNADLEAEFIWSTTPAAATARRAGSTSLTLELGAPNNVESAGTANVGSALASELATYVTETVNTDASFKTALQTAAGNKAPTAATVTAAPSSAEEDDGGSSIIIIIIIIILILLIGGGAAAAVYFLVVKPKQKNKAPKVQPAGTYDHDEHHAGGV